MNNQSIYRFLDQALGLEVEAQELNLLQMSLRALVMVLALHQMLRLAPKRFFAARNAVDILMAVVLASAMSRAINGDAAFFSTIAVGFLLVGIYRGLTLLACDSHRWGRWLKGISVPLIENGVVDEKAMRRHRVSRHDLMQDLRLGGSLEDPQLVRKAVLERNGEISVIRVPRVFTIGVEQGVQTVRIEIEG